MTAYRVLSVLVMVGAVCAVTLPPLSPVPYQIGAAVLAFVLGVLAFLRLRTPAGRVSGVVFLGLAFLCLSFAVPRGTGLGSGLAGAGAATLLNAWIDRRPGEEEKGNT